MTGVISSLIELIIFDCDGVLVDTERIAIRVDVEVLAELGWAISEAEVVDRFVGVSEADFRTAIEERIGRTLPEGWEEEIEPRYRAAWEKELAPVPGVTEAIDRLDGYRTCVASSGGHEKMRFTLGITGLYGRFEGRIFSATEVRRGKPAPDLFLHAAESMGVRPERCVVVEDSAMGVAAARAAGMRALAYGSGVTPPEKLAGPGTTVFHSMDQLPHLIEHLDDPGATR